MQDFTDEFTWEKEGSKYKGLRDYHLRSALSSFNLSSTKVQECNKKLIKSISLLEDNFDIVLRDPGMILGRVFSSSPSVPSYGPDIYHAGYSLFVESSIYPSLPTPFYKYASEQLMNSKLKTKFLMPSLFFQKAIITSNALNAGKEPPLTQSNNSADKYFGMVTMHLSSLRLTLKILDECFGVILEDNKMSIHDLDHLRNWSDKCTERFNVELACIFGHHLNPVIYPPIPLVYDFWAIWDCVLERLGNPLYKCIKVFEALCIGVMLVKNPNDHITQTHNFLESTINDFLSEHKVKNTALCESLIRMRDFVMSIESEQYISQLYGLYRTWGHPIVVPKEGMLKVMKLGLAEKSVSKIVPVFIRRIFMTRYSTWFKTTKGSYPEVKLKSDNTDSNSIMQLMLQNRSTIELSLYFMSPEWDHIRFEKNIEIPKTFNLSEMVADKAVSPDRFALLELCNRRRGGLYDANYRRGVLQWLLRDPESCEKFLTRVNDNGLSDNECIIGLYQKERELNEKPRMFALMSHSMRNYVVTTESMLSSDILPAFPSITMTDDLLSLQKKIYSVSYQQARNSNERRFQTYREITTIVNIDFEKWNLNFRRETTHPIFEAIGDLYGLPQLYNRTYDIFQNSFIYLADGSYRPKLTPNRDGFMLDPPFSYNGHLGGFEGLRQKGWTLFTVCGLELVCSRHKCSFKIMGQGDNQVLILTWKTYLIDENRDITFEGKRRLSSQFDSLIKDLTHTFAELGLPIKALETWSSEHLFLYGKVPTLRGVPLAMSLKKLCRAYYLANEEIMTLDCSLATIQSNAMAACMSDVTSHVPYVIYKIQAMMALSAYSDYHVLIGRGAFDWTKEDKWRFTTSAGTKWEFPLGTSMDKWSFLTTLSWFPKSLGGLNVATWFDFLMRGFPDKASQSFTWIKALINVVTNNDRRYALETIYQTHINPEKNFILLIEDPCALNLVVPVDARSAMKQAVQELFENLQDVKNEEFSTLFQYNKEWKKDQLCNSLCEADILHPRLLHDLVAASPGGYIDSIVSKVSKASTINKAALKSSSRNPGSKIVTHESNVMKYFLWKLGPKNPYRSYINNSCPSMQCREIRLRSWDKILEGVSVPHPLAFLEFRECSKDLRLCDQNYISITLPEAFCNGDLSSIHTLGAAPPYLGSITKEKISGDPNRQVFGKEPLISRPLQLLRVINWFVPNHSHAANLIKALLAAVSDLNPDEHISREMGITGSEAHRYRDQALKHGVMTANLYTLGSHMHISTDPWLKYTRGTENYTINYQAILCSLQALIGEYIFWCCDEKIPPKREYHFHESCPYCIEKLSEEFHDLANDGSLTHISSGKGNQYLWVSGDTLTYKYKTDPILLLRIEDISDFEYAMISDKRSILTEWIAADICNDVLNESRSGELRMLESRDYPRVMYKKLVVKELWEEVARLLIARAGVKYSSGDNNRVAYLRNARELAADDIMKCSSGSLMGASMFYTWEEKFQEIYIYDKSAVYPDTNPPTLESSCIAAQINLRDLIKRVKMRRPHRLIIPRTCRQPDIRLRSYWYTILMATGVGCPQCIKTVSTIPLNQDMVITKSMKCKLGHVVISNDMLNIKTLTATEDRLLKDSLSNSSCIDRQLCQKIIHKSISPGYAEIFNSAKQYKRSQFKTTEEMFRVHNHTWKTAISLPTSSAYRVEEMLSIINHELGAVELGKGMIFGDGLGESSRILSNWYKGTEWVVNSLQDSERAIPQSYPHALIPGNPVPLSNLDYKTSKSLYNDILSPFFKKEWSDKMNGGFCWYEAEVKGRELEAVSKVVLIQEWEIIVGRVELNTAEIQTFLDDCLNNYMSVYIWVCGSLDVANNEIMFACRDPCSRNLQDHVDGKWLEDSITNACDELYVKMGKISYAEYLVSLETSDSVAQMIKRCDHWFAQIGVTHLLNCTNLFTPIWWDIQTGKIPEIVKDIGENRIYFMYRSDIIALQSRLISLAISLLSNYEEYVYEMGGINCWKLDMERNEKHIVITMTRGGYVNYGDDELKVRKFVPVLRKLNKRYNRWWTNMPDEIIFSAIKNKNVFWISKIATLTPGHLPEIE